MSPGLLWSNLLTYSLQVGLFVGIAAAVPSLLRLRLPRARLLYWHILLAVCLLLPMIRPWRQTVITDNVQVTTTILAARPVANAAVSIRWELVGLGLLAIGVVGRLIWLGVGYVRLRKYVHRSSPFAVETFTHYGVQFRISEDVTGPVTFGLLKPVVLLPPQFPELDPRMQHAILVHEVLHVERRDWLFTWGEELVRAILWFHPAIWWLLGEIQLTREQAVDHEVVGRTQARDEYVDALLAIAGAAHEADLAPAPSFLRKRHLKHRVASILKEVGMSKKSLYAALATGLGVMALACWLVTTTLPLSAAPQVVNDGAGVSVDLGGAALMHRSPVTYPQAARTKRIEGDVSLELTLDSNGAVADAKVISGPIELRNAAQQSVLQWHFLREAGPTRRVTISFRLPPNRPESAPGVAGGVVGGVLGSVPTRITPTDAPQRTVKGIVVSGVSEQVQADLLRRLPVHQGDVFSTDLMRRTSDVIREFDEHLSMSVSSVRNSSEVEIQILAPGVLPGILRNSPSTEFLPAPPLPSAQQDDSRMRIGGNVMAASLVTAPKPVYPQLAKQARIQGVVKLSAVIGTDGTVKNLEVINGHPLLVPAALEAVRQWVYKPVVMDGVAVEVITQIDVNFTLSE